MASKEDSTGGTTPNKGKAVQAKAEVGGVRSSDDPVPDLWFGQPAGERRDATCSAGEKRREGCGDGRQRVLPGIEWVKIGPSMATAVLNVHASSSLRC